MRRIDIPDELIEGRYDDDGESIDRFLIPLLQETPDTYVEVWDKDTTEADYDVLMWDAVDQEIASCPPFELLDDGFLHTIGARVGEVA